MFSHFSGENRGIWLGNDQKSHKKLFPIISYGLRVVSERTERPRGSGEPQIPKLEFKNPIMALATVTIIRNELFEPESNHHQVGRFHYFGVDADFLLKYPHRVPSSPSKSYFDKRLKFMETKYSFCISRATLCRII